MAVKNYPALSDKKPPLARGDFSIFCANKAQNDFFLKIRKKFASFFLKKKVTYIWFNIGGTSTISLKVVVEA